MIRNEALLQLREAYIEIGKMVQKYGYGQYNGILRILMGQVNCIDSDESDGEKMKYLKQFLMILAISFLGELMHRVLPLPVPASIYGMVILFVGLITGMIQLDWVKDAGKFLIEIMPVMFIPAGVGLMSSFSVLRPVLVPVCVITLVTVVTVMVVTGRCSQWIIRREKRKEGKNK